MLLFDIHFNNMAQQEGQMWILIPQYIYILQVHHNVLSISPL